VLLPLLEDPLEVVVLLLGEVLVVLADNALLLLVMACCHLRGPLGDQLEPQLLDEQEPPHLCKTNTCGLEGVMILGTYLADLVGVVGHRGELGIL
jgi:hypothetical protein